MVVLVGVQLGQLVGRPVQPQHIWGAAVGAVAPHHDSVANVGGVARYIIVGEDAVDAWQRGGDGTLSPEPTTTVGAAAYV